MRLSIDHLFCFGCTLNTPFFHNFTTKNDPLFLLFRSKFWCKIIKFWKNFANCSRSFFKKMLKLPRFCAISHPMTLFIGHVTQWPLFFGRKPSPIAPWLDASVGTPTSLICEYPRAPDKMGHGKKSSLHKMTMKVKVMKVTTMNMRILNREDTNDKRCSKASSMSTRKKIFVQFKFKAFTPYRCLIRLILQAHKLFC